MSLKSEGSDKNSKLQEDIRQFWWSPSAQFHDTKMNHDDNLADDEEQQPHSSTPHLPRISPRYDTPDSDYNYEVVKHLNKSNEEEKNMLTAVSTEPPIDASTNYASSIVSGSEKSIGKISQQTGSIKKGPIRKSGSERSSSKSKSSKGQQNNGNRRYSGYSGSYTGSDISNSQRSYRVCDRNSNIKNGNQSVTHTKSKYQNSHGSSRQSVRDDRTIEADRISNGTHSPDASTDDKHGSLNEKVIRSCTYAEGFGSNKNQSTSFPLVNHNERGSKSAKELGLTFDRDFSTPVFRSPKSSARSHVAESEDYYTFGSHYKLSLAGSNSITARNIPDKNKRKSAWSTPTISPQLYQEIKERLLKEGRFKDEFRKYWGIDIQEQINKPDSDDDGYDTDLDTNLGLELIADEHAREVREDGIYPEYKHNCRRFKSTPNSYFMRHSLEDNLRMRYRYLNKGDSIAMSTQMKNHLTMSEIDLKDNCIGSTSMNYFKHMLKENKRLTELNLSCNNLGPEGAKHMKNALRSNCFLLKLNVAKNNFGEKGSKHCARLLEENVNLKEMNISGNAIGDYGAILISKALEGNVSLKLIDLSWNHIGRIGGVKLCDCLKNNTELVVFRAETNGFGDEGGKALINSLKVNHVLKEVDLSNNRLTDTFMKSFTYNLSDMEGLAVLKVANNNFQSKPIFDFLAAVMTAQTGLTHIDIEGVHVTEEFKGLANAIKVVQDVSVMYNDPPSKREMATDVLTRNLVVLCEFLEAQELEVEDLYPDYEEIEEESDEIPMVTVGDVITQLEQSGKVTRPEKIRRLKANLKLYSKRKFHLSELALVYDKVICGKDVFREKPLRSHLRRSIREERAEKTKQGKRTRNGLTPVPPKDDNS